MSLKLRVIYLELIDYIIVHLINDINTQLNNLRVLKKISSKRLNKSVLK